MLALAEKLSVPGDGGQRMHSSHCKLPPNDHPLFLRELEAVRYPRKQYLLISFGESFTTTQADPLRNVPVVHISHDPNTLGRPMALDLAILSRGADGHPRSFRLPGQGC